MTPFQKKCYETLKRDVHSGSVITYAGLAKLIGHPNAHRAVGSAMNKNPFAPEVPCHRVVKSTGELGGFAQDIKIKIKRLQKEGIKIHKGKIVNFKDVLSTSVKRAIIGFHQDDLADWVAELECGHFQHVRHDPPWIIRPWIINKSGRVSNIGSRLHCKKCTDGAPKDTFK